MTFYIRRLRCDMHELASTLCGALLLSSICTSFILPSRQQRSRAADESPSDRGGLRDVFLLSSGDATKRGLLCESVVAYASLYLHLCVIENKDDYFYAQGQDE